MTKEEEVEHYLNRINKAKMEIKFCEEEINMLNGYTETCPHCRGEKRFIKIHRMFGSHVYANCFYCKGKGKVTKGLSATYIKDEI